MILLGQLEPSPEPDLSGWACVDGQDPAPVGRTVGLERGAGERSASKAADGIPRVADEPDAPIRSGGQHDLLIRDEAFALGERSHLVLAKAIQAATRTEPEIAFAIFERRIHQAAGELVLDAELIERAAAGKVPRSAQAAFDETNPEAPVAARDQA